MNDNPFSPSWYRVATLRPRLRSHHRIIRHVYRGKVAYLLADRITGDVYRFTPAAYRFIGLMNGTRSVQEILDILAKKDDPYIPGQDQVIEILSQLHTMDALVCDVPPDTDELLLRRKQREQPPYLTQLKQSLLFLRFPLFDPEKLLLACRPVLRFLFTRLFFCGLLGIYFLAAMQLLISWPALTSDLVDTLFTRHNLLLLWCIYPLIKAGHELAHALAVKKWGGEVHEIGIMLLLLLPVPYVDASSSATFRDKGQRITVSGAGVMTELLFASIALLIWPRLEPGLAKSIAYNVIMIGGFSTLLFNGNPLVRFDGYYVLSDLLELPNLAQRSRSYLSYLVFRYLLGIKEMPTPSGSAAEKRWYLLYGVAAFVYRIVLYSSIFLLLSHRFSWLGTAFGVIAMGQLLLVPACTTLHRLFTTASYQQYRSRMLLRSAVIAVGICSVLTLLPLPYATRVEGVVWPPDDSFVRMHTAGFIKKVVAPPNGWVQKNDTLIECEDPQLSADLLLLQSQIREYQTRKNAAFATAPIEATIIDERLQELQERLLEKQADQERLTIRSPAEGQFVIPGDILLSGRFMHRGDPLAYVLATGNRVRTVVSQEDIDIITEKTRAVELLLLTAPETIYTGRIATTNPQATLLLPDPALGTAGGGSILMDPADPSGRKMLEERFQLDITLDSPLAKPFIGSRVLVRFDHGNEPLAIRWLRKIRQLFLAQLHG
jgi:putative peptide zinc metalloprotease protein